VVGVTPDPTAVVRQALGRVLDPMVVEHLRGDSPVLGTGGTVGLSATDAIAVADAVQEVAREAGAECLLQDEDLNADPDPVTLAGLAASVARQWREEA
jgi:hypothetical protein